MFNPHNERREKWSRSRGMVGGFALDQPREEKVYIAAGGRGCLITWRVYHFSHHHQSGCALRNLRACLAGNPAIATPNLMHAGL
jgi:hypothetical protein